MQTDRPLNERSAEQLANAVRAGTSSADKQRRARLFTWIRRTCEEHGFYDPKYWPLFHITNILKIHKTHDNRTTLYFFLTFNGMDPDVAPDLIMAKDAFMDMPVWDHYDYNARYDLRVGMPRKAKAGTLWNNINIFNIEKQRVEKAEARVESEDNDFNFDDLFNRL